MAKRERPQPLYLFQMLPRTNCKLCGCKTCMAFAFSLISRDKKPEDCPPLLEDAYKPTLDQLKEIFGGDVEVNPDTGLLIEEDKCVGCGDCVVVCKKAITTMVYGGMVVQREDKPMVLQVVDGTVQVVNWRSCKRAEDPPDYCRVCEEKCRFGALELVK